MKQQTSLLNFVADSLSAWDGIVEREDAELHCLLPSSLAQQLVLEEDATIALPSAETGVPLIYGEALLDNIIDWVQDEGRSAQIELKDLSARSGGLRGELQRTAQLRDAVGEVRTIQASSCTYLILHYRLEVQCQEMRQGHTGVIALNEATQVEVPWLPDALQDRRNKDVSSLPWNTPFEQLAPVVHQKIQNNLNTTIAPFLQQIEQRISRERRRFERQHRRERRELLRPLIKDSSLDQTEALEQLKQLEQAYIDAVQPLPEQYPIHVHIEPYAALRVSMPVTRVDYHIRKRKESRDIRWYWNPIIERFEPLRCEDCGEETFQFTANDSLRLSCRRCADS